MHDYSITKNSRKCSVSGRGLEPGESYYSVILPNGDDVSRVDIAASAWTGPSQTAIGWWRNRMPAAAAKKIRPAPHGVLLDTLSEMLERPGKEPLAYLLALLLVRRHVLQEEHSAEHSAEHSLLDGTSQKNAAESPEIWDLVCPADGRQWRVPNVAPDASMVAALQAELKGLLFTDE